MWVKEPSKELTINDISEHFRITFKVDPKTSMEGVRQFCRVIENIIDNKPIIVLTNSVTKKVTYHATGSDVARYLNSIGIISPSTQNILAGLKVNGTCYGHTITRIFIKKEIN